jgi:uncharacterized protein
MTAEFMMALGLVFVIEGLLYALLPGHLKRMLQTMQELSDDQLRMGGVSAIAFGVMIVWVVRSLGG